MTAYAFSPAVDVERAIMKLLRQRFPVLATPAGGRLRVATEVPADLDQIATATVPFVRVSIIGGGADRFDLRPTVDIDVFARDRDTARNLAAEIEAWLLDFPHRTFVDSTFVLLQEVSVTQTPQRVPFQGEVKRFLASYQISARR